MTKVAVLREPAGPEGATFRAIAGQNQSAGRTAGEAIDALTSQLAEDASGTFIIVRDLGPDQFFNAGQRQRLQALMARWRTARDTNAEPLSAAEQAELADLVDAEVRAATLRAAALRAELAS